MTNKSNNITGAILSVDFGLKRTGLAVCDENRRAAVGAGWLEGLSGRSLARKIRDEAAKRQIDTILIGDPPAGARDSDKVIEGAEALAEALIGLGFEVMRWNEDFTTASVLADRRKIGGKSSKHKGWIDEAAAVLILKSYIECMEVQNMKPYRSGEV